MGTGISLWVCSAFPNDVGQLFMCLLAKIANSIFPVKTSSLIEVKWLIPCHSVQGSFFLPMHPWHLNGRQDPPSRWAWSSALVSLRSPPWPHLETFGFPGSVSVAATKPPKSYCEIFRCWHHFTVSTLCPFHVKCSSWCLRLFYGRALNFTQTGFVNILA